MQSAVQVALNLAGQPPLLPVSDDHPLASEAFFLPALRGSWKTCIEGLAHPHTGEIRPIVFDHSLAKGRDDVVLAHLNHRLVQMSLRLLRAEIWTPEGQRGLHRVTIRKVPNHLLDTPAAIAHARLVVIGGDSHRLHEEIITAGGLIRQGRFSRLNVGEVNALLDNAGDLPGSQNVQEQLISVWPKISPSLLQALEARMRDRLYGMQRLLEERQTKEISDINAILTELQTAIEKELKEPEYRQLELWNTNEREQLSRNIQALRIRLEQIPEEREKEIIAIEERYADPQPRMFPVAVTFLVPEKLI